MRRVKCGSIQREGGCWKALMPNHLKTNSEWPQSGPAGAVIAKREVLYKKRISAEYDIRCVVVQTSRVEPRVMKLSSLTAVIWLSGIFFAKN